jgi:outer membrane protein OmpU
LEGKLKKQLLTSTALVAAGSLAFSGSALAQNKPTISISGSTEQVFGIADNDNPGSYAGGGNGWDQQTDSEIHFNGSTTLDNGIKINYRIELEGNTSSDQIDEHWMTISGSFGQITLGSQDGASQIMVTGYQGSWSTGVGQNLSFDVADWIEAPTGHTASTVNRVTNDSDAEKISYFTPRFEGFQLGVSYVPNADDDVNTSPASRAGTDHQGYQIGANFVRKFGDVGMGAAIGYSQIEDGAGGNSADNEAWGAGIRLDFAGFRVGLGYVEREDASGTAGQTLEGETWDAGIRYTFGPNAISLTYQDVEMDTNVAGTTQDETTQAQLSFRRTLGPGVQWSLEGKWAEYTGDTTATSDDNEGYAVTTSIKVRF